MVTGDPFEFVNQYKANVQGLGAGHSTSVMAFDGSKFPGGFGLTRVYWEDYWELRARSSQLFTENPYARGIVRRLVTNEINVGLMLEAEPNEELLGNLSEDEAEEWTEDTENRFEIWASNPGLCDYEGRRTFGLIQEEARREALIGGDVLVVLHIDRRTQLPQIELIRGDRVDTPLDRTDSARIEWGVELDRRGRQVAYWVQDGLSDFRRIPARGARSGRRIAWLQYGTDMRTNAVRGTPLLSLALQSLKDLDRARDAELRAAVINGNLAMYVEKTEPLPSTLPLSGGAVRNVAFSTLDATDASAQTSPSRQFNAQSQWPGMVLEELQQGETPKSFDTKRPNVNYGVFESSIVHGVAWALEIPPEILTLEFGSNYAASKAAINEFKAYIVAVRSRFGATLCQPVYEEWLRSELLAGRLAPSPGLLESFRDPLQFDTLGAWTRASWGGPVKPSVDMKKDVDGYLTAIEHNLVSADRTSKDIFGVRFSKVIKRRRKEIRMVQDMNDSLGIKPDDGTDEDETGITSRQIGNIIELVQEEGLQDG